MSVVVGIICAMTGRYRWAIWIGWVMTTFGAGLLIILGPDTTIVQWVFLNFAVSIGTGMLFPAMALAIQAAGRPKDAGHAAAFYSFIRVIGRRCWGRTPFPISNSLMICFPETMSQFSRNILYLAITDSPITQNRCAFFLHSWPSQASVTLS
jgi:hypothetical protein